MNEKEFLHFISQLRVIPLNNEDIIKIVYIFYVWKILSETKVIKDSYLLSDTLEDKDIYQIFKELSEDYIVFKLFNESIDISKIRKKHIFLILEEIVHAKKMLPITEAFNLLSGKIAGGFSLQIADLSVQLLGKDNRELYAPFGQSFNVAYYTDAKVYAESHIDKLTIEIINILDNVNIEFHCTNVLENPSFLNNNQVRKFENSISFPPFSVKNKDKNLFNDEYHRFKIYNGQAILDVAHFEHILAQTSKKAIILTSVGFTFREGVDKKFRKYLIDNNWLEAIIHLPPNIHSNTSIETVFFVVNKEKNDDKVYFLDLRDEQFIKKYGRKIVLNNLDKIVNIYKEHKEIENISSWVTLSEIIKNDYLFTVERYIISQDLMELETTLSSYIVHSLGDIAELRRSQLFKDEDEGFEAYQLSPTDFAKVDYTLEGGKIKQISTQKNQYETYKLLPDDILVSVKGTIGKVAIIGEITKPLIASQAIQIIRITNKDILNPIVLYMFFKSTIGQLMLKKLVSGSVMPQISTKEMKQLKIPLLSLSESQSIIKDFKKEIKLSGKIYNIEQEIEDIHKNFFRSKK